MEKRKEIFQHDIEIDNLSFNIYYVIRGPFLSSFILCASLVLLVLILLFLLSISLLFISDLC